MKNFSSQKQENISDQLKAKSWWENLPLSETRAIAQKYFPSKQWFEITQFDIEALYLIQSGKPLPKPTAANDEDLTF